MHRTAPTTKNYLAPNIDSAEVAKPWSKAYVRTHTWQEFKYGFRAIYQIGQLITRQRLVRVQAENRRPTEMLKSEEI